MQRSKAVLAAAAVGVVAFVVVGSLWWLYTHPAVLQSPPGPDFDPVSVNIAGEVVCLPHKGDGPQTMECAFGLRDADGIFYGMINLPQDDFVSGALGTGMQIAVTGVLRPSPESRYAIVGTIDVESYSRVVF